MNGYATARQNGWMSANDIRELENMDRIPAEDGGDLYLINGNMLPLGGRRSFCRYTNRTMTERRKIPMKKFWKWKNRTAANQETAEPVERTLFLNGTIAEESWFDDDVTPAAFQRGADGRLRRHHRLDQHLPAVTAWRRHRSTIC